MFIIVRHVLAILDLAYFLDILAVMLSNSMKSPIEICSLLPNHFSFTIIPCICSSSQLVILGPLLSHIDFRADLSRTIKNNCRDSDWT